MTAPVRIAMWSGPRTISTALMRSFGNRADAVVVDEPLYAYYLAASGVDHPGRAEIIESQSTDWRAVLAELTTGALPAGRSVSYQKHMAHHLLPEVDRAALRPLRHAFLIRDPRELLASYARVRSEPTAADLGLDTQLELFHEFGGPVVDSRDVCAAPETVLRKLCAALGIGFDPAMLRWPAGPRDTDGVWARHWYAGVRASTGFRATPAPASPLPDRLGPLLAACGPPYREMYAHRLRP